MINDTCHVKWPHIRYFNYFIYSFTWFSPSFLTLLPREKEPWDTLLFWPTKCVLKQSDTSAENISEQNVKFHVCSGADVWVITWHIHMCSGKTPYQLLVLVVELYFYDVPENRNAKYKKEKMKTIQKVPKQQKQKKNPSFFTS